MSSVYRYVASRGSSCVTELREEIMACLSRQLKGGVLMCNHFLASQVMMKSIKLEWVLSNLSEVC